MACKLNDLKKAHVELMTEYVSIINQASNLSFLSTMKPYPSSEMLEFPTTPWGKKFSKIYKFSLKLPDIFSLTVVRFFVKLFVETHIKGKLNEIRDSYVQLAQSITTDEASNIEYQNWLKQTEEGTKKFADTLSSLQSIRGLVSVLLPWVSGLLIALLSVDNIYQIFVKIIPISTLILSIGLFLVISLLYFCLFILSAFHRKRTLFYHSSEGFLFELMMFPLELAKLKKPLQLQEPVKNVYQIEDKLFHLLGKRKPLELPIDLIMFSMILFMTALLIILERVNVPESQFYQSVCYFFLVGIYSMTVGFHRRWR